MRATLTRLYLQGKQQGKKYFWVDVTTGRYRVQTQKSQSIQNPTII